MLHEMSADEDEFDGRDTIFDAELYFLSDVHDTSVRGSRSAVDGGGDPGGLGTGRVTKTHTSNIPGSKSAANTDSNDDSNPEFILDSAAHANRGRNTERG